MIRLDSKPRPLIEAVYEVLEGWFPRNPTAGEPEARFDGKPIALHRTSRADLGPDAFGFRAYLDHAHLTGAGRSADLTIEGDPSLTLRFEIAPEAREGALAAHAAKARKRDWLKRHLRAVRDRSPVAALDAAELRFENGDRLDQTGYGAVNALDPAFGFDGRLSSKRDGVSAHPYPSLWLEHLEAERAGKPDFMALDFGAGVKSFDRADVIHMEVFDYPSTDLMSAGQALPFADATFDAVVTLAVLEHVDDPFACAAEITRVLKPGGLLFSGIPFMQPEHGYPDHFFNATRSGHAKLYGDAIAPIDHLVDDHQHPWLSLQWILRSYASGLPAEAREAFTGMTVAEIMKTRYWRHRAEPMMADLSDDARWELASATTLIGRRR